MLVLLCQSCSGGGKRIEVVDAVDPDNTSPRFTLKVYVENSGSMYGYMCGGAELKDALYSYASAVGRYAKRTELNYINSEVVPLNTPLDNLVSRLSPEAFSAAGGNMAHSDFKQILADVINHVNDTSVVVWVSDCILDVPQGAANYLYVTRTDIGNLFTHKLEAMPSLGISIYQMKSSFDGIYYYPAGGHEVYKGKRPYYMWVMGPQRILAWLKRRVTNEKIQHGVSGYVAFAPTTKFAGALFAGKGPEQSVRLQKTRKGAHKCHLMIDLSPSLLDEHDLTNPSNYFSPQGKIKVEHITELQLPNAYSHLVDVELAEGTFIDNLNLRAAGVPLWVKQLNGTRDDALESSKTFSIGHIIGGVADAYEKYDTAGSLKLRTYKQ